MLGDIFCVEYGMNSIWNLNCLIYSFSLFKKIPPNLNSRIIRRKRRPKLVILKFIHNSEKATEFCEISTVAVFTTQDKSTVKIFLQFLAFSEYINFNLNYINRNT